ncbi:MAG TPA: ABC transporter permease [Actinomycetota bacterium]|nr:ABC transporter permease [Actinomycetota bacterium]
MGRYLIRRSLFLILVLFIVSFLTFLIFFKLPPGDPARLAAGRRTSPDILAQARENLGLDRPFWVQYWRFAQGLIPGPTWMNEQVYFSYNNFVPVWPQIQQRLPYTITLALGAAGVWLLLGLPIGIVSAIRPRTVWDRAGMLFALFGVSAPVFWLGYLFLYVFWFKLQMFPGSSIPIDEPIFESIIRGRFVLPWVGLSLTFAAFYARMVRGNLMETMTEDYIRTARAKGLSERRVVFKHGLRSALTPVVTMFGLDLGLLLGGAVITEQVFNIPGIGQYVIDALTTNDFPAVMGVTVFAAFFIVVANLVVDVAYAFLDPRVRYT